MMDRLLRESNPPTGQLASPKPQYKDVQTNSWEELKGEGGASYVKDKDALAKLEQARALLAAISGKDFATQTTLAAVLAKLADLESELATIKANQLSGEQKVQLSGTVVEVPLFTQLEIRDTEIYHSPINISKVRGCKDWDIIFTDTHVVTPFPPSSGGFKFAIQDAPYSDGSYALITNSEDGKVYPWRVDRVTYDGRFSMLTTFPDMVGSRTTPAGTSYKSSLSLFYMLDVALYEAFTELAPVTTTVSTHDKKVFAAQLKRLISMGQGENIHLLVKYDEAPQSGSLSATLRAVF